MKITVTFKTKYDLTVKEFDEGMYNSGLDSAFDMVKSLSGLGGVTTLTVQPDEPEEKLYYVYDWTDRMNHITGEKRCTCHGFVSGLTQTCRHMYRVSDAPVTTLLPSSRESYEAMLKSRYPHSPITKDGRKIV